jgi:hypothetical protein
MSTVSGARGCEDWQTVAALEISKAKKKKQRLLIVRLSSH